MAAENDWEFLRAALPDLRDYILSADVYWTLQPAGRSAAGARLPRLTLGNLLLSQARLSAVNLDGQRRDELEQVTREIGRLREEWRSNWSLKAGREFSSRLNLWQQYVRDLRGDPRQHAAGYASEVRSRAILRLLRAEMLEGVPASEEEMLAMVDQILRGLAQPGPFVWEPEVAGAFPQQEFWFLYVKVG